MKMELSLSACGLVILNTNEALFIIPEFIAAELDIEYNDYVKILKKHNCDYNHGYHYFYNKEDAQLAIAEIEPYIIMQRLVK